MSGIILRRIFIAIMVFPSLVFAFKAPDDVKKAKILNNAYRIRVPFIENRGQVGSKDVSFYAKTFGGTLFVEKDGILTYNLPSKDKGGVVIKEIFTDRMIKIRGLEPSPTKVNYFKGKDKSEWETSIPSYESLSLGQIYKGIGLELRAYGNNVEKLYTVYPKNNPDAIKVKLIGAKGLKVNEKGELEVITKCGSAKFTKPLAYQEIDGKRIEIAASYAILQSKITKSSVLSSLPSALSYGFKVDEYNKNYPLIIDPLLASTFIGGANYDYVGAIALDESGNVYVTGYTYSSDYPTTSGACDESYNGGNSDVIVSKINSSLSSLLASTFIGGSSDDHGFSIAIDGSNVYVTGETFSSDYPTISGAYDESHNGGYSDVIVSKLDSDLSSLLASTLIGGIADEEGLSIALDGSGNVYVTGLTLSSDYPTTSGAYDESHNGYEFDGDVFVSKLDSDLENLEASTFIGGGDNSDYGYSIALDESGNVYVTGLTLSSDYPTTSGAYDESHNGGYDDCDVFITKLNSSLSSLLASTFIGGGDYDRSYSIAIDGSNVYVTGETYSSDYPTTSGAYDESHNGGNDDCDVFVSKLNSSLSSLLASTFIGGGAYDESYSIALDESENVYVTGYTGSSDYPTTTGAYDESHTDGDNSDVFVSKLDSNLGYLLASTFIGGGDYDYVESIALDGSGNVYVTGWTLSSDYPTTTDAYNESFNGYRDIFVSKLSFVDVPTTSTTAESSTTTTVDGETTTTTSICPTEEIYGEYSETTELLRYFRNNVLRQTPEGKELIALYYQWSPVIVKAMEEDEEFKEKVKELIDGILPLINFFRGNT